MPRKICPKCNQGYLRENLDGDLGCFCGYVKYKNVPLDDIPADPKPEIQDIGSATAIIQATKRITSMKAETLPRALPEPQDPKLHPCARPGCNNLAKNKFCSIECSKWRFTQKLPKAPMTYKTPEVDHIPKPGRPSAAITRICKMCNKLFTRRPSLMTNERGIYCSHKCQASDPDYREKISKTRLESIAKKQAALPTEGKKLPPVSITDLLSMLEGRKLAAEDDLREIARDVLAVNRAAELMKEYLEMLQDLGEL